MGGEATERKCGSFALRPVASPRPNCSKATLILFGAQSLDQDGQQVRNWGESTGLSEGSIVLPPLPEQISIAQEIRCYAGVFSRRKFVFLR
jgi:hypothetical protein